MPRWIWTLHKFSDRSYLGRLDNIYDWSVSPAANAAGSASFKIPLEDDMAYLIDLHEVYVIANRDGEDVFEGKVMETDEEVTETTAAMTVNCLGWWEILDHRFTHTELVFENQSAGHIAWSLLAHSQSYDGTLGFVVGSSQNAGFVIPKVTIAKDSKISEWIDKLTKIENGIDFEYDGASNRYIFLAGMGEDKPDAQFGFQKGPHNLTSIGRKREGARKVNKMKAISSRSNNYVIETNDASIASSGVYMEIESLSGISPSSDENQILAAYAAGETIVRGDGITTYRCNPVGSTGTAMSDAWVPMPWDDFRMFDVVRLSVSRGRFVLNEAGARVYGWTVVQNASGDGETLTSIALAP